MAKKGPKKKKYEKYSLNKTDVKDLNRERLYRTIAERKCGIDEVGSLGERIPERDICKELGISKPVLWRITRTPEYSVYFSEIVSTLAGRDRLDAYREVSRQIFESLKTLVDLRDDPETPPSIRLQAAKYLLAQAHLESKPPAVKDETDALKEFLTSTSESPSNVNIYLALGKKEPSGPKPVVIDSEPRDVQSHSSEIPSDRLISLSKDQAEKEPSASDTHDDST